MNKKLYTRMLGLLQKEFMLRFIKCEHVEMKENDIRVLMVEEKIIKFKTEVFYGTIKT